jgi:hypothetical protein
MHATVRLKKVDALNGTDGNLEQMKIWMGMHANTVQNFMCPLHAGSYYGHLHHFVFFFYKQEVTMGKFSCMHVSSCHPDLPCTCAR